MSACNRLPNLKRVPVKALFQHSSICVFVILLSILPLSGFTSVKVDPANNATAYYADDGEFIGFEFPIGEDLSALLQKDDRHLYIAYVYHGKCFVYGLNEADFIVYSSSLNWPNLLKYLETVHIKPVSKERLSLYSYGQCHGECTPIVRFETASNFVCPPPTTDGIALYADNSVHKGQAIIWCNQNEMNYRTSYCDAFDTETDINIHCISLTGDRLYSHKRVGDYISVGGLLSGRAVSFLLKANDDFSFPLVKAHQQLISINSEELLRILNDSKRLSFDGVRYDQNKRIWIHPYKNADNSIWERFNRIKRDGE